MPDNEVLGDALADMVKNAQRAGFTGGDIGVPCCDYRDHAGMTKEAAWLMTAG